MPGFSNNGETQILDEIFNGAAGTFPTVNPWIGLHTGDPGETGANEVTGGTYARQQANFSAAASGTLSNSANIEWDGIATTTLYGWSAWDAATAGNCFFTGYLGTVSGLVVIRSGNLGGNVLQGVAHGLAATDRVVFEQFEDVAIPTGVTLGTIYFVLPDDLATDTFSVSTTSGGTELDITAVGSLIWRKVVPLAVTTGQLVRIAAGELDIYAD